MEFESPDVERDFPGLYASESGKRSNESDFSDETHERISKKDLLIGKRKDKKDSKKDRGYATLEGESSPEEDTDIKSPSKLKKSKPFKFSSKKEKREKSREKDVKEKESDKDKKKSEEKEKEKKKDTKVKLKLKERKKSKHGEESNEVDDLPIFGVPLSVAVERSKCHDGVDIPLVVRDCIDHIQQTGLTAENLYKISGIKSRVQQVKRLYNQRKIVHISDYDLPVATSLLKTFLRELPEPLLTSDLISKFEEAGALRDVSLRGAQFKSLVDKLPSCNKTLLAWLLKHFDAIADHEKQNKMNAQSIATALSPVLQTSERLLSALLCHSSAIFPNTRLTRYVPPLSCGVLPETINGIIIEIRKQESLLSQIHKEMQQGRVSKQREEQLWEVQRIITQLKRKLRALEKANDQRSLDETDNSLRSCDDDLDLSLRKTSATPNNFVSSNSTDGDHCGSNAINTSAQPLALNNTIQNSNVNSAFHGSSHNSVLQHTTSVNSALPHNNMVTQVSSAQLPTTVIQPSLFPHTNKSQQNPTNSVNHLPLTVRQNSTGATNPPTTHGLTQNSITGPPLISDSKYMTSESMEVEEIYKEAEKKQKGIFETEELVESAKKLMMKIDQERKEVEVLRSKISQLGGYPVRRLPIPEDSDEDSIGSQSMEEKFVKDKKFELKEETRRLEKQKQILLENICAEHDNCIDLRVQIKLLRKNH